jgi:hypothetical protein
MVRGVEDEDSFPAEDRSALRYRDVVNTMLRLIGEYLWQEYAWGVKGEGGEVCGHTLLRGRDTCTPMLHMVPSMRS